MFWTPPSQMLLDPQQQNSYSYSRNNPINLKDPSGLLTVIVPGTNHNKKDWSRDGSAKDFIKGVEKTFNETAQILDWSGGNTKGARQRAAESLTSLIKNHDFADGEKLNIVGHSHGGNIGIIASQMTDRKIDNLVTLGTPARSDYRPNYSMVNRHINAYSNADPVQTAGGMATIRGGIGIGSNSLFGPSIGIIPAGRTFSGAENIGVTSLTGWGPVSAHSDLWRNSSVWSTLDSRINK